MVVTLSTLFTFTQLAAPQTASPRPPNSHHPPVHPSSAPQTPRIFSLENTGGVVLTVHFIVSMFLQGLVVPRVGNSLCLVSM